MDWVEFAACLAVGARTFGTAVTPIQSLVATVDQNESAIAYRTFFLPHGSLAVALVRTTLVALTLLVCFAFASSASAGDLSGHWSGDWKSCTSGHKGPLSAEFCKVNDCSYEVRFKGRFFKVFPFRYKVTLQIVEETPEKVVLAGSQDLGRIFGTFTYSATVTDNCFHATYTSCKDDGIFRMERCTKPCEIPCEAPCELPAQAVPVIESK